LERIKRRGFPGALPIELQAPRPASFTEIQATGDALQLSAFLRIEIGRQQGRLHIDQRYSERLIIELGRGMANHDRIVPSDALVAIGFEYRADPLHAARSEFRRAQRTQAGAADHRNAVRDKIENFLVPDGRGSFEAAVDQSHRGRRFIEQGNKIATAGGRTYIDIGRNQVAWQCRPHE